MMVSGEIRVQTLNHLGLIAGLVDEIGVVEQIDRKLGKHPKELVSAGQAVKAMIINLDSSSFHVHGEYKSDAAELSVVVDKATLVEPSSDGEAVPKPIQITQGYSRDHRPDLKQFIIDLICSWDEP